FSELGAPAVKYYPDELSWAKTQPSKDAPMNFDKPDKFVKDYQEVGFSELVMGLKTQGSWAVKDSKDNFAPKPEFLGDYGKWIKAVVERYDMDGDADIVGLKFPVRFFEIGTEFSSFEPEPVEDYITMLEAAYKAAHEASEDAIVMNAAFLTTTAFKNHPAPGEYEESCRRGSGSHAD
ncbi:MAG: hypothetical protein FJ088_08275, partial [Deltaproteobacteria bacterium]|nr:hypothetical protein [Deltaproteobacteria bacterium]